MNSGKKNILIIDDHDCIRQLLGMILSKRYSVTQRRDGLEGMLWLGDGNMPDLIILDIGMPYLDGFSFIENLKNSYLLGDIPVVIVSGNEDSQDRDYCLRMGAKDYFTKPFNPLDLQNKIDHILS